MFRKSKKELNVLKCKKISIFGPSGSGKSTLAIKLGELLNLPVFHIDNFFWKPNWIQTDKKVLCKEIKKITKQRKWIIDGTYSRTLKNRFKRSDLVIFLDFSEEFCINSVKERFKKGKTERVGLREDLEESVEGINDLIELIRNFSKKRQSIIELFEKYAKNKTITLKTREGVNDFIDKIKDSCY